MTEEAGGKMEEPVKAAGRFRTALPQVLASTAKNMILLDLGMTVAFPTIVIPALHNTADALSLNNEQTSWFGSIMFICQPVGSVLSGLLLEHLGRKNAMILVNIPHMLGWCMFYFANSVTMLYVSTVIMGLGVGFMEAPIITYVGEISQPELRGILTSYPSIKSRGIFVQFGFILEYLMGTVSTWRTAAIASAVVPVITVIAITQVPETPIWLLSKGRVKEAEKALCWLRGWVPPSAVKKELDELIKYSENNKNSKNSQNKDGRCGCLNKARLIIEPQTLRPLFLVIMFFFFQHWSGMSAMRPYMVQVFDEFGVPVDAHWTTVITGVIGLIGNIVCMVGVPYWGKRPISLVSMAASSMCCNATGRCCIMAPMLLFVVLVFMQSVGVMPIPWMILSEVFPFRSRGLASGLAAAGSYVLAFIASKTFLNLKADLGLFGVFFLYGILAAIGYLVILFTFSETEGRSLEDIEEFYKKGMRGKIPKTNIFNPDLKQNSMNLCKTTNTSLMDSGHANMGFNSNEEVQMINKALFENSSKVADGISNHDNEGIHNTGIETVTKDTTFIENEQNHELKTDDITKSDDSVKTDDAAKTDSAAPQIPMKRKSTKTNETTNDKDTLDLNSTEENGDDIETLKGDVEENMCVSEKGEVFHHCGEEANEDELGLTNCEMKQKHHVNIIHEKAEVHSEAEVETKTRM
ncbi:hypothetical protein L9F63_008375 [Diploptera punctata]|uniref:Major facilitator superfamily (MFS) profile domain-containing protein n=1 Tax=Diploptera punctata TaxID=6984 RepID=A0AAD7Z5U3_DIPPU|nr:hypothetical protein L9F63_008375 [Diploptera punctata]